jgi:hypothetical protein
MANRIENYPIADFYRIFTKTRHKVVMKNGLLEALYFNNHSASSKHKYAEKYEVFHTLTLTLLFTLTPTLIFTLILMLTLTLSLLSTLTLIPNF